MKINNEKITREFCQVNAPVFHPQTIEEAVLIQRQLLGMGFRWNAIDNPPGLSIFEVQDCIQRGIVLDGGKIFFLSSEHRGTVICTADQFAEDFFCPDRAFMMEMFNKLSARIEQIAARIEEIAVNVDDVSKKVDAISEELRPAKLDKPGLKNPGQDS